VKTLRFLVIALACTGCGRCVDDEPQPQGQQAPPPGSVPRPGMALPGLLPHVQGYTPPPARPADASSPPLGD